MRGKCSIINGIKQGGGAKQGGILSLIIFAVSLYDPYVRSTNSGYGCYV